MRICVCIFEMWVYIIYIYIYMANGHPKCVGECIINDIYDATNFIHSPYYEATLSSLP